MNSKQLMTHNKFILYFVINVLALVLFFAFIGGFLLNTNRVNAQNEYQYAEVIDVQDDIVIIKVGKPELLTVGDFIGWFPCLGYGCVELPESPDPVITPTASGECNLCD